MNKTEKNAAVEELRTELSGAKNAFGLRRSTRTDDPSTAPRS